MLYRKAPPRPTRLLLRVVAVTGSGALLAAASCSSPGAEGSLAAPYDSGYDDHAFTGSTDSGSDDHAFTGSTDGGSDDHALTGSTDGGSDVVTDACCGIVPLDGTTDGTTDGSTDGPIGVVVNPDGGQD